jgi:hypothetical protein
MVKPIYSTIDLALSKAISLLPCPEHHIGIVGNTHTSEANIGRNTFPFLHLDIISRDDMSKQRLDFIDRKESSGANAK